LEEIFGADHQITGRFILNVPAIRRNQSDASRQEDHRESLRRRRAVLESAIEQIEMLRPAPVQMADGHYHLHPEIERVSRGTFRDGHYKQAAFEAYVRVINEVKDRSGRADLKATNS
jgi:hypothetical protein